MLGRESGGDVATTVRVGGRAGGRAVGRWLWQRARHMLLLGDGLR